MKTVYQLKEPKKYVPRPDEKTKRQIIEEETGKKMTDFEWYQYSQMLVHRTK